MLRSGAASTSSSIAAINRGDNCATTTDRAWDEVIVLTAAPLAVTKPSTAMNPPEEWKFPTFSSCPARTARPGSLRNFKAAMVGFTKCPHVRPALRRESKRNRGRIFDTSASALPKPAQCPLSGSAVAWAVRKMQLRRSWLATATALMAKLLVTGAIT